MAYRLLIVDDSPIIRSVIKKALSISGLDLGAVLEASDGEGALEMLEREWVDVVLADINMPNMRGDELIARLRSNKATASLPVIVISSIRSESMREAMAKHGVDCYITKPFYPAKLRKAVVEALGLEEKS